MSTKKYRVSITTTEDMVKKHWTQFVEALKRFGTIVSSDTSTLVITITSELGLMTFAGRAKDAIRSIYFGADVSCSPA